MEKPFKMMTQALMGNLRDCSDVDNSIKVPQTHLLPSEARQILPNWSPNEGRAARFGKYYSSITVVFAERTNLYIIRHVMKE